MRAWMTTWGALLSLALPGVAAAQAAPSLALPPGLAPDTRRFGYSAYEQVSFENALSALGFTQDDEPEGKIVESIHAVALEVIEERDPAPRFLNVFHVLTRHEVIDREVLLRTGDVYRQTLADETQRNLASLPQLSLVLVFAARGSAPDKVRIVVVTKDVWSLRLDWDVALGNNGIEGLTINPTETNFLGTHQSLGLLFHWLPLSYSLGASYVVPRILGSRVAGHVDAGLIVNTPSGSREGSFGDLQISYPLWSSVTEWSWSVGASWLDQMARLYRNGKLASFSLNPGADCGPANPCVPYAYRASLASAAAAVRRSFGWRVKHDVTAGLEVSRSQFSVPDRSSYDGPTVQAFEATRVPVSDDRVGPFLQYSTYTSNFLRVLDLETLALQEDYRLGHEAYLRFYPVLRFFGSSRDFLGVSAGLAYTLPIGDGLARMGQESILEIETGTWNVKDGSLQTTVRLASPSWSIGRLVLDGLLLYRYRNSLHRSAFLGGDSRIRGYPSDYFVGSDALAINAEYRSRPLELFHSVQIAGALFWDAGDAFDDWTNLHLFQSVGLGARVLFPQLDRLVFRIDVAFPTARPLPQGVSPVAFFATFGQAFSAYEIAPRTALTR